MKLMIIRHGDPDYENDSLTQRGLLEAAFLNERLAQEKIDYAYSSPLGRALLTGKIGLQGKNIEMVTLPWLREFQGQAENKIGQTYNCSWDWLPEQWTECKEYFDRNDWDQPQDLKAQPYYDEIVEQLDLLLQKHGYNRYHDYYKAVNRNDDVIVLFCHFGVQCVILSHLMNVSPMVLWHSLFFAPTSVTTLVTEERREGNAYFRVLGIGDISHLYAHQQQPSFAGRFCEQFTDEQRHD